MHRLCWCYISKWWSNTIPGSQICPLCFQSSLEISSSGQLSLNYVIRKTIEGNEISEVRSKTVCFVNLTNFNNISNQKHVDEYDKLTKSTSSTIDEILALDVQTSKSDMYWLDFELQLHTYGDCDAGYKGNDGLLSHIKSNHKGAKYSCDHCEYKTRDKSNLNKPWHSKHEGVKYSCNQCKYHTKQQISLRKASQRILTWRCQIFM